MGTCGTTCTESALLAGPTTDEDGALATDPFLVRPFEAAIPEAEPLTPGLPLATAYDTSATIGDVQQGRPTAHCDPYGPTTNVNWDDVRDKWYYTAGVGVKCTGTKQTHCYVQLVRRKDTAIWPDSDDHPTSCIAFAPHGFYKKRTAHYSDAALRTVASVGVWLRGDGPGNGWECSGWGTNTLDCRKDGNVVK